MLKLLLMIATKFTVAVVDFLTVSVGFLNNACKCRTVLLKLISTILIFSEILNNNVSLSLFSNNYRNLMCPITAFEKLLHFIASFCLLRDYCEIIERS